MVQKHLLLLVTAVSIHKYFILNEFCMIHTDASCEQVLNLVLVVCMYGASFSKISAFEVLWICS